MKLFAVLFWCINIIYVRSQEFKKKRKKKWTQFIGPPSLSSQIWISLFKFTFLKYIIMFVLYICYSLSQLHNVLYFVDIRFPVMLSIFDYCFILLRALFSLKHFLKVEQTACTLLMSPQKSDNNSNTHRKNSSITG